MDKKKFSDRHCFPAIFYHEDKGYSVVFPDLERFGASTQGKNFEEAQKRAHDVLGMVLYWMERDGDEIPRPSLPENIECSKNAFLMMIEVFMPIIRDYKDQKAVQVNCTMPNWLKQTAEAAGINFSQVLQSSLKQILDIKERQHINPPEDDRQAAVVEN
ncbi:MAG: type II toxin-antitoxin system HicB family antitoxin [Bacillota bacterium]